MEVTGPSIDGRLLSPESRHSENRLVLLVDDDEVDRERIRRLSAEEWQVQEARTGQEVRAICAAATKPACVVLDYLLPGTDGFSLLRFLMDREIPVVMLTGQGTEQLAVEAMKQGASDFLVKEQATRESLQKAVGNAIEKAELQRECARLEIRIQQSQKLESLGVLAGGVAHDFNNLLAGIMGNASLALDEVEGHSPAFEFIEKIECSAMQAAELTRQMLAYSGQANYFIKPLDVNRLVRETFRLMEDALGPKTQVRWNLAHQLPAIEADEVQIRQVFMNLFLNASEAIEENEGTIVVKTEAIQCNKRMLKGLYLNDALREGRYVVLEVSDTGKGMDGEVLKRIFDPFFSTKFQGRGLGLAAVLGIVRGHESAIKVSSEPGRGTIFRVLFPACEKRLVDRAPEGPRRQWRGQGVFLVVDDEAQVRSVAKRMLEKLGFTVLLASSDDEALEVLKGQPSKVDYVLLDLTMLGKDSQTTLGEIREISPGVRVIMSTGYGMDEAKRRFANDLTVGILEKPYTLRLLTERLHEFMEGPP